MNWFGGILNIWVLAEGETAATASWRLPDSTYGSLTLVEAQAIVDRVPNSYALYSPHPVEVHPS